MKKFYVTTAADYVNARPHIGHAFEKALADAIVRWHRQSGEKAWFLTGTDDNAQKNEQAAKQAGIPTKEFVNKNAKIFIELCKKLNIAYDDFIRTTEKRHVKVAQEIFKKVYDKGEIYKGKYEGYYCYGCEAFITEKNLVAGKCPEHNREPEWLSEESYFFKLSKYKNRIINFIENYIVPESRKKEILVRLEEEGLKDLCVSRTNLSWGIDSPVDKNFKIYVWFDALINYISGANGNWPADVHVIGKGINWFHSVIWPAILISAGYKLPKKLLVHSYLNIKGQKMSKSLGNVIDPIALIDKYGTDAVRYSLLKCSAFEDSDYSEEIMVERNNTDLANILGNLVSRTLTLMEKFSEGKIPEGKADEELKNKFEQTLRLAKEKVDLFELHHALEIIWSFISEINKYVDGKKPWELAKQDRVAELNDVLYNLAESLRVISALIYPFIPGTAEKISKQLGLAVPKLDKIKFGEIKTGVKTQKGKILFEKIEFKPLDDFSQIDLRVGQVKAIDDIPGSDNLYKLQVEIGLFGKRQLVAGVKKFYTKEQLFDKKIILVANLKPAKIRGVESNGMLLAVEDEKHGVEVLTAEKSKPGDSVSAEDLEKKPAKEIDLDFFSSFDLEAKDGFVFYGDKKLKTDVELVKSGVAGKIR